jgi:hypothetical protein
MKLTPTTVRVAAVEWKRTSISYGGPSLARYYCMIKTPRGATELHVTKGPANPRSQKQTKIDPHFMIPRWDFRTVSYTGEKAGFMQRLDEEIQAYRMAKEALETCPI